MNISLICIFLATISGNTLLPYFSAPVKALPQQDTATLKSVTPFPVGAAISIDWLRGKSRYKQTIINQYNSITAENVMKFGKLHPSEKVFRWKDADEMVDFANQNGMRMHGHTLIWAAKNPKWVNEFQGNKQAWKNLLKTHIQTIVKHYKGKVTGWDVVNEPFADNGQLKKSIWLEKLGPEYIELAFKYAHEADPDALLFLNEYGHEYGGRKMKALLNLVTDFKKRKVPIHGLGLQMHVVVRLSDEALKMGINGAAKSGLLIHISELEITVRYQKPKVFQMDSVLANQQAHKYQTIFELFSKLPKAQQYGITTWNVSDADAFRNAPYKNKNFDHPMMFDQYFQPKPAFQAVIKSMQAVNKP